MKFMTAFIFTIAVATAASIAYAAWPNFATFSVAEYGTKAEAEAACLEVCHAPGGRTARCEYDWAYDHYMCMFRRAHRAPAD